MIKSIVHLQRIEICDCKKMEQVIVGDGSEEEMRMLLRELGFLKLGGLPKLTRFCTCDLIECPALNELQIKNCPVLMTFVSSSASAVMAASSEREILDYTLFNEKVAFPNLVQVQISNADALRKIWHNHLHSVSFYKLRVMKVEYGNQLVQIFPSNIFKRLENLKDVVIRNCDSLEVVFDLQELVINITESITSELRDLDIRNLQNLKYVWNKDPQQALSFPSLLS
ncbi:uncharacterized protein LOC105647840 [Jatropha curcas]|uniref:uncharacterized protein LOC105647840 n=1 Tax=Jatropha curcas TaxID=180498 RepID=UPI0018947102|nr:uncharacterized protein LOC105647840 [Jatropha curcas]